jgi:hypothetical protein
MNGAAQAVAVRSWVASSEPTAQLKLPGTRFDCSFYEFAMHSRGAADFLVRPRI